MNHRLWKPEGPLQHPGVAPAQHKPESLPLIPATEGIIFPLYERLSAGTQAHDLLRHVELPARKINGLCVMLRD